jgi:transposase
MLGIDRRTIARYLYAGSFVEISQRKKMPSALDPYEDYIQRRWNEGCHNGSKIWREICDLGFKGSRSSMARCVARLRQTLPYRTKRQRPADNRPLSSRRAAWILMRRREELKVDQSAVLEKLLEVSADIQCAYSLAQEFAGIIREKKNGLAGWLQKSQTSSIPEFRNFAISLQRDLSAVEAALSYSWSNGPVEGHVNRLKLIKRQMYGRANFDLLRLKVLYQT